MTPARQRLLAGALAACVGAAAALASDLRFPPPEFETAYTMPVMTTPPPGGVAREYFDLAILVVTLLLAAWLVHARRSRRGLAWLSLFSLAYFGFYREGCICPIGAPQNVAYGLFQPGYAIPVTVLLFFLVPLVFSLFTGRTFCAAVCPHGALQDLVLVKPLKVPLWLEQGLGTLPYLYLGAGLLFAGTGVGFLICRYDPFVPLFRLTGSLFILTLGGGFLLTSMFIGRPFCRFLCPYGALLRLGSLVSKWRVRITPNVCTQCRLCEHSCPFGAIREPQAAPASPAVVAPDRRRLGWLLLALPVLIAAGAWLGNRLSVPAARLHPTVALAETFLSPRPASAPAAVTNAPAAAVAPVTPTPETRALARAELEGPALVTRAAEIRSKVAQASLWFGAWTGLVIGLRLISLTLRTTRTDFEPDRGGCYACGRCYLSCPNERVRLGLISPAEAAGLNANRAARPPAT